MPANNNKSSPILCPADNCSVPDTSIDDRTLASVTSNALSISSLALPDKLVRTDTSPRPKHRAISGDAAANENWRPNVTTIKEKSTDSADSGGSAVHQPIISQQTTRRSFAKSGASGIGSFPILRPPVPTDSDIRASTETHVTDLDSCEDLASFFQPHEDEYNSSLFVPLEKERGDEAAGFSFSSLSRLPPYATSGCEKTGAHEYSPGSGDNSSGKFDDLNFSFSSRARLPLYTMPRYPPTISAQCNKLKQSDGEQKHAVAAKHADFEFPSTAHLPHCSSIWEKTMIQGHRPDVAEDFDLSGSAQSFSFPQRSRLPLHPIAGAENKHMSFNTKQSRDHLDREHGNGHFEFKRGPYLTSLSSMFKCPVETTVLGMQLARKGLPLEVSELTNKTKKAHVFGSIDSVGEFIRPNAENSFLFSITPFSKQEIREKKKANELLFGKLEKARWKCNKHNKPAEAVRPSKPEPGNEVGTLRARSTQTERSIKSEERGMNSVGSRDTPSSAMPAVIKERYCKDQQSTEDRHRFDALVTRLQQKLSEQSDTDRRSTSTTLRRAPGSSSASRTQTQSVSQSTETCSTGATDGSVDYGDAGKEATQPGPSKQLIGHGSHMNYGTMSRSGKLSGSQRSSVLSRADADPSVSNNSVTGAKESNQPPKDMQPSVPESDRLQHKSQVPSVPIIVHSTAPPPLNGLTAPPVFTVPSEVNWMGRCVPGQIPVNSQGVPAPYPSFPGIPATPRILPQPDLWQVPTLPPRPSFQAPAALMPSIQAVPSSAPDSAGQYWPVQKRPRHRRRAPYVALNAAEQQKIEEHIELLKSTIPNFATVSKRRQQIRWERQQDKLYRQNARNSVQITVPYLPQSANWQQQQQHFFQQPPAQCISQGPQYYQPGNATMAPQSMHPYFPYAQQLPTPLGACTWPVPRMNMMY